MRNTRGPRTEVEWTRRLPGLLTAALLLTTVGSPRLAASSSKSPDDDAPEARVHGACLSDGITVAASGASPAPAAEEGPGCVFCRALEVPQDFCPHCGRLSAIVDLSPDHRSWIDVPYVVPFPALDSTPEIVAQLSSQGLLTESVVFSSGDRYDMKMEKKGAVVRGMIGVAGRSREAAYKASIEDVFDAQQRLTSRQVFGEIHGDPDQHLYRKLDYKYSDDGHLDRIEFKSWYYRSSSDWKKRPSAWVRHSLGEIVLRREGGALSTIETKVREGGRSLRGETEYGEPRLMTETVTRTGDRINRLVRTPP